MSNPPLLLLFGDSLILDSIEASLASDQASSVLRLRTAHPEIAERLKTLAPTLVIFDLDAPNLRSILPFLRIEPRVSLLGVDVNGNIAVSLTCIHHHINNQGDLRDIIHAHISADPVARRSPPASAEIEPESLTLLHSSIQAARHQ